MSIAGTDLNFDIIRSTIYNTKTLGPSTNGGGLYLINSGASLVDFNAV